MRLLVSYLLATFVTLLALATPGRAQPALSSGESCESGWVWREAFEGDYVCVDSRVRAQVWADNEAAESRYAPGHSGPATCRSGFVWRLTVPEDLVCVPPESRDLVLAENRAHRRIEGPITSRRPLRGRCMDGYLERRAHPKDDYCVLAEVRARVVEENGLGPSRRGSDACIAGFVWREAAPNDRVCVDPRERNQARSDNAQASLRVLSGICRGYASEAVAQFNQMMAGNCGRSGSLWSSDYDWHYQRCSITSRNGRDREADERRAALRACGAPPAPPKPRPPGECLFTVHIRNVLCLDENGNPSMSLEPGGSTACDSGGTVEIATARARAGFESQFGSIAKGETPTDPYSCTVTEEVVDGCLCS